MFNMTFRGITKSYVTVLSKKRPPWAPIKRNLLKIEGMPGSYLESTDTEERPLEVTVLIEKSTFSSLEKAKEDLAAWLITDEAQELVFDDEPDRIYNAVVDDRLDLDEIVTFGRGTITFICPDPRKYGPTKVINFQNASSFYNNGTDESDPIVTCTISQDTTYVAVGNGDKINLIGNPAASDQTPFEPETPILISGANSLTGWTNSSATSVEASDQTGTLKTDGDFFWTDTYGTSSIWHGPAMKTSLGSAVQDFRFDVGFSMLKTSYDQAGGVEVSLLDANSQIVTKLAMTKHYGGLDTLYSKLRAGTLASGFDVISEAGYANFKNAFGGVFRMYRKGTLWTAQIFQLIDGKFQSPITKKWTDKNSIAAAPVTQVQVRLLQRADFPVLEQKVGDIQVYRLNDPAANQVPYVARVGDIIEFDHTTDIIRRNGEDITSEKAFIGEYFPLLPGANTLVAEPQGSISNVEVRWREGWL